MFRRKREKCFRFLMGQKQKTPLVACVFYFVLTCISFWLNVNRYTYFLALALHFLSCCCCCCWCPPLPLLCHLLPFLLLCFMLQKLVIFCDFGYTTFLWRSSPTKRLIFCHRRSLGQVDGEEIFLYEKRPRGNFWSIFRCGCWMNWRAVGSAERNTSQSSHRLLRQRKESVPSPKE